MNRTSRAWGLAALGAAVSALGGILMRRRRRGAAEPGILGFGLAHIVLGLLDRMRVGSR